MTPPFTIAPLLNSSDIGHGFFGRQGGVSTGIFASLNCGLGSSDQRGCVIENRHRVGECLAPGATLLTIGQIHSAKALIVTDPWPVGATPEDDKRYIPVGDAMVTDRPGLALGILAADCAPVLLADVQARVIGAAHAGWKGALGGVIEAAIDAMETLGARRGRISAAIGPAISAASYEVGPEFKERFLADDAGNARFFAASKRAGHYQFDLPAYATGRLERARVGAVANLSICTYCREADYFSYRRRTHRGEMDYGRNVSAILLKP